MNDFFLTSTLCFLSKYVVHYQNVSGKNNNNNNNINNSSKKANTDTRYSRLQMI